MIESDIPQHSESLVYLERFDFSKIFIGRKQELLAFSTVLERWLSQRRKWFSRGEKPLIPSPHVNKIQGMVVLLYGKGGFGKTTLLHHFRQMALRYARKVRVSKVVDWEFAVSGKRAIFQAVSSEYLSPMDYFGMLQEQLTIAIGKKIDAFLNYNESVQKVLRAEKRAQAVIEKIQKTDDKYNWLRSVVSGGLVFILREITPGGKLILNDSCSAILQEIFGEGLQKGIEQLSIIKSKLQESMGTEIGYYLEPHRELVCGLGRDLARFARLRRLLLFFDTYEDIAEGDDFLRIVMMSAGSRVGWVIAGRDNLWAGKDQRMRSLDTEYGYRDIVNPEIAQPFAFSSEGEFTQGEIEQYFAELTNQTGVPSLSKQEVKNLQQLTHGVPLAVKIAAGLYLERQDINLIVADVSRGEREIIECMVERYLLHTHSDLIERMHIYGLAILRRANQPTSIALALQLNAEEIAFKYDKELRRLHRRYGFIFTDKDEPSLHQDVRYFMRKWLRERRKNPEVQKINRHILDGQEEMLKSLEDRRKFNSLQERIEDQDWMETYLDLTEQYFWADPIEGIKRAIPLILVAYIYSRYYCDEMIAVGNFFQTELTGNIKDTWQKVSESFSLHDNNNITDRVLVNLHYLDNLSGEFQPSFKMPFDPYSSLGVSLNK